MNKVTYFAPNLPLGTYRVTVAKAGFQSARMDNIILQSQMSVRADLRLSVGNVAESVSVTAEDSNGRRFHCDDYAATHHEADSGNAPHHRRSQTRYHCVSAIPARRDYGVNVGRSCKRIESREL